MLSKMHFYEKALNLRGAMAPLITLFLPMVIVIIKVATIFSNLACKNSSYKTFLQLTEVKA